MGGESGKGAKNDPGGEQSFVDSVRNVAPDLSPLEAQRIAKSFIEQLNTGLKDLFPEMKDTPDWIGDPRNLFLLAKRVFDTVKDKEGKYPEDDETVLSRSLHYALMLPEPYCEILNAALMLPSFQLRWLWAGRWYAEGMPRIVWEHARYPETLMASSADPNTVEFVRPPWRAFVVNLPRDLLESNSVCDGKPRELKHMLVLSLPMSDEEDRWAIMAEGEELELWRHGITTGQLLEVGPEFHSPLYTENMEKKDDRMLLLLGRLLVGLCLTLTDPLKLREARHTKRGRRLGKTRTSKTPLEHTFVVGAPTKVRVREALKAFVENGRKRGGSPTVQSLVRGHFKMQPHGPRSSLRKLIYREPFWRGPEDAPINVKDTAVDSEPGS